MKSHDHIYRAIAASDVTAAKKAMAEHIQDIIDRSIHRLARANAEAMAREMTDEEAIYTA
jgi:DNA-binding GntR family transcriptional regulator